MRVDLLPSSGGGGDGGGGGAGGGGGHTGIPSCEPAAIGEPGYM